MTETLNSDWLKAKWNFYSSNWKSKVVENFPCKGRSKCLSIVIQHVSASIPHSVLCIALILVQILFLKKWRWPAWPQPRPSIGRKLSFPRSKVPWLPFIGHLESGNHVLMYGEWNIGVPGQRATGGEKVIKQNKTSQPNKVVHFRQNWQMFTADIKKGCDKLPENKLVSYLREDEEPVVELGMIVYTCDIWNG